MKKITLNQMEKIQGGRLVGVDCADEAIGFLVGAAVGGAMIGGLGGAMLGSLVGLVGSTFMATTKIC